MAHKNKQNYSPYKARKEKAGISLKGPAVASKRDFKPEQIYGKEEANDRLADIFRNHEFSCSHQERSKLAEFYTILMRNQEHQNFTRLLKLKDIAIKHFIDSLIVADLVDIKFPLLDVGTGPGFPGVPLKIRYPTEIFNPILKSRITTTQDDIILVADLLKEIYILAENILKL